MSQKRNKKFGKHYRFFGIRQMLPPLRPNYCAFYTTRLPKNTGGRYLPPAQYQTLFQVLLLNRMSTGRISSLPRIIVNVSSTLEKPLNSA